MLSGSGGCRPPGNRPTSGRSPALGNRRWPVGCEPSLVHGGFTLARPIWVHPGDVHSSQDHCHSLACIPQPCNGLNGPKGPKSNKNKKDHLVALHSFIHNSIFIKFFPIISLHTTSVVLSFHVPFFRHCHSIFVCFSAF